jgi:hypothetical protein
MARADGILAGEARTAMQSVLVAGSDLTITLVPVKGASVAGTITFETAGSPTPTSLSAFRVNAVPLDPAIALPRLQRPAIVNQNASFQLVDLVPGRYVIQASAMRGWTMKSATLNGRDVSEEPVEIKGGEQIDGLSVIFSDRTSGISGTVADGGKPAAAGLTVIAFPAEDGLRRPQSRRIRAARTTEGGAYTIGDLPPGDYLVVVVDDVEQGEWFDPEFLASIASGAVRTSVEEGAQRQLTLKPPRAP